MYTHRPPFLGSNVPSIMVSLRGPSHWTYSSGSVNALNTNSRGASNSRVMSISCFPGSAIMVVLFLSATSLHFLSNSIAERWLVMHTHHPGLVRLCAYQMQVDPVGEHALTLADGDGMDHEHVLINQTEAHKRLRVANAATHAHFFSALL